MSPDPEQPSGLPRTLAVGSGGLVAVTALAILAVYCTALYDLLMPAPGSANPVKPNTALCLLLLGLAVVVTTDDPRRARLARLLLTPVMLIAVVTLWEYGTGRDAGIDSILLGRDHPMAAVRMLPSTAVCLGLLSGALLLPRAAPAAARSSLLLGATWLAMLNLTAASYRAQSRYGLAEQASMPAAAALLIALVGLAGLALRPDLQPVALLSGRGLGSRLARWVMPLALVLPIALGWLRPAGRQLGLYDEQFGIAVTVACSTAVLQVVTYWACLVLGGVEAERERAMAEALHRQELFGSAVEGMTDCFMLFSAVRDEQGRIVDLRFEYLNEAACRCFGTTKAESVGRRLLEALPRHREALFEQCRQVIETGEPMVIEALPYEDRYLGRTPIQAYFDLRASKLSDGLTYIARDVTERVQAEEALEEQTRELERSNRELQSFAYIASHDLQEPLRKIRTFGERVERLYAASLGDRGTDFLHRIRRAAERMSHLLDALLEYSRVSHQESLCEAVDLNQTLRHVLGDLEVVVEESGATVTVGELPVVMGHPTQLHALFQNLVANAIKFQRPGVAPEVEVTAGDRADGLIWIHVSDHGIGFESRFVERIFEPFQRLHTLDDYAGAGMGLTSAKRVAERHGGRIEATGQPDVGAEFRVLLPLAAPRGGTGGGSGNPTASRGVPS